MDRLAAGGALADRHQLFAVGGDGRMAVHAGGRGRHRSEGGLLDRGVAIAAIDAQLAGMQGVAIGHRLLAADSPRPASAATRP